MNGEFYNYLPLWATLLPVLATIPLYIIERRSPPLRDLFAIAVSGLTLLTVAVMYPYIKVHEIIGVAYPRVFPPFGISFQVDLLGYMLALIAAAVWFLATVYSKGYMSHESGGNRYYPFLLLCLGGCMGVFLSGDFFSLFVFFELMSLTSYVLVVHEETQAAMQAGYKYLILTLIGGLALFFGIVIAYEVAGNVEIGPGNYLFTETNRLAFVAFLSFLVGFGMKMGIFPMHVWLPDAHPVAPSPASALLSGVMLKTGAYGLVRVIYNVYGVELVRAAGWHNIILVLATITVFLGSAVAIAQTDIKRRLAYSSISQMGYVLLGIGLLTATGLQGGLFHIFSHAMMKSTLFLAAGAIIFKTGKRKISELSGIGYQLPVTMVCFSIAALAMIGIPPLNGFISKLFICMGALDAGMPFFVVLLIISSLMNGIYYLPIIISAFFGVKEEAASGWKKLFTELRLTMLLPICILTIACVVFGLFPGNFPLKWAGIVAKMLLGGG